MCGIKHWLIESEKKDNGNIGVIPVKAKRGILPYRAAQAM